MVSLCWEHLNDVLEQLWETLGVRVEVLKFVMNKRVLLQPREEVVCDDEPFAISGWYLAPCLDEAVRTLVAHEFYQEEECPRLTERIRGKIRF
jgi:hypothetical protein